MGVAAEGADGDLLERWRALAAKAAGRPATSLASATAGGLPVAPLYPRLRVDDGQPWRAVGPWAVAQRVDHPDAAVANAFALADLEGGADALTIVGADAPCARGYGLAATDLAAALEGVELDLISLRLDGGGTALAGLAALEAIADERRLRSAGLAIDGGCDPIGTAACAGAEPAMGELASAIAIARRGGFAGRPLLADGRPYHEAGAGEAEELAAVLATAISYVRALGADGLPLDQARDAVAVLLPADAELLSGIAKMRAMRRLWARVEELCRLDPRPLPLHAETSWRCLTRHDPHTNALRGALGATAAGLGGADAVTVLPMTLAAGLPDAAARRLARNTGRVLIDEAQLARVDDSGGGSGAVEAMTAMLCEEAWTLFQQIERHGGLPAAGAWLHRRIAATAARRAEAVACLARGIVGTTLYPSLQAPASAVLDVPPRAPPTGVAGLPRRRDAEPFERLRDRAEAAGRPPIVLAALGTPASYGPRAAYAVNLLAAAGLAATEPRSADDAAAMIRSGAASVACLCGSDASYEGGAAAAIAMLREAGAAHILLVGDDEPWRKAGADALIHDGCPALQLLEKALICAIASVH